MYGEISICKSFWVYIDVNNWVIVFEYVCKYKDLYY